MVTQKYRISSNNRVFGKNIISSLILSCCLSDETFLLEVLHITFVWLNGPDMDLHGPFISRE